MPRTTRNTLIILGLILLALVIMALNGWKFGDQDVIVDESLLTEDSALIAGSNSKTSPSNTTVKSNTGGSNSVASPSSPALSDTALATIISNSRVRVPQTGVDVALTRGESNFVDGYVKGKVSIGRILGKVPTDSGVDVFVDMTMTIEGRESTLHYIALFKNVGQSVLYTSSALVGDRVQLLGVTAAADQSAGVKKPAPYMSSAVAYSLTVQYLDRRNGEPITAVPSFAKTVTLHVKNHFLSR